MTTYAELRLRIDRGVSNRSYRIVATGPAGEALGRFRLPFSDLELENFVLRVGRTRRGTRRIESPEMELAKDFGSKLFGALFEGDVRELYRSSFAESRSAGQGLRVTLSLTSSPELLQVPWEYLYDHPSFLSISSWTPIVRYLDLPRPRRPIRIGLPLRILGIVSAPNDAELIDAGQERAKLEAALAPLIDAGSVAIDWLEEPSLRALQRQLRRGEYHVLHYIGHGGYDHEADDGVLLFEDEQGRGRKVTGVQLGTILADEVSLRLAVLNSCEGGRTSLEDPFSGVATSLIEREIPAVIGMQFEITDRAAIIFAAEFYAALADGLPVDSAVAEARKAIYADENDIEWGTPVLFMRVADGRLFDVDASGRSDTAEAVAGDARVARPEAVPPVDDDGLADHADEPPDDERADDRRLAEAEAEAERERVRLEAAAAAAAAATPSGFEAPATPTAPEAPAKPIPTDLEAAADAREVREAIATGPRPVGLHGDATAAAPAVEPGAEPGPGERSATRNGAAAAPQAATAPQAVTAPAAAPTLARAAVRGAVGGIGATLLVGIAWQIGNLDELENAEYMGYVWGKILGFGFLVTFAMAAAVTLAEGVAPAVRVPEGSAYRRVGHHPLASATAQGVGAGLLVGAPAALLSGLVDIGLQPIDVFLWIPVFAAVAFTLAEAIMRRRSSRTGGSDATRVA